MTRHFQLYGSVRPYFGRTTRPRSFTIQTAATRMPLPGNWMAPVDDLYDTVSPFAIVLQVARLQNWTVLENGKSCDVIVPIGTGAKRKQIVSLELVQHDEPEYPLLVYTSRCGPATSKYAMVLLRRNSRLLQTAFSIEKIGDVELIVLRGFQRADCADVIDVAHMIALIASQADRIEAQLVGADEF